MNALQKPELFKIQTACVIEDDADMRYCIVRILTKCGLEVSEANSGEEGLQLLANNAHDIVFCDLRLGAGESGEATMQAIMKMHPETKVIAMSAAMSDEQRSELLALGIDECFRKPFFKNECLELLAQF